MMIMTVPMVSVLEQAVCVRYYHGDIPNPNGCKIPPIQQTLAEIRGWTASFETFAGMACRRMLRFSTDAPIAIIGALLIGRIADYRGHRGVFMVIATGMLMSLTWTLVVGKYFVPVCCPES